MTSSGLGNLDDVEGGSVKHIRHYQVYRGMSPTASSRLEVYPLFRCSVLSTPPLQSKMGASSLLLQTRPTPFLAIVFSTAF